MKRLFFSVVVAAAFGALTYFAGDYLYTMERIPIDASDSEGHGPDYDSAEWRGAVRSGIQTRCLVFASMTGLVAFAIMFRKLRPAARRI